MKVLVSLSLVCLAGMLPHDKEMKDYFTSRLANKPLELPFAPDIDTNFAEIQSVFDKYLRGNKLINTRNFTAHFIRTCYKYSFSPRFILALINTESSFNTKARSWAGARGLMQLLPGTGKYVAKEIGIKWEGNKTLYDPRLNIRLGMHYLSYLRKRYKNNPYLFVTAYNYGPGNIRRIMSTVGTPPASYLKAIKKSVLYLAFDSKREEV